MSYTTRIINLAKRALYYRNPINIWLGRKVYQNDSGYISNFVGSYVLHQAKKNSGFSFNQYPTSDYTNNLKEEGWVKIERFFDECDITDVRSDFVNFCEGRQVPDSLRLEASSITMKDAFFDTFPGVKKLINDKVKSFLRSYYQSYFQILNVHLYRIYSVPDSKRHEGNYHAYGATECWHNDGSSVESIKLFVLIDDVGMQNGPMHLLSRGVTQEILKKKFNFYKDGRPGGKLDEKFHPVQFTGKAGDILLANPNTCLHRASSPVPGAHRDMLVFYISCSERPLEPDWEKNATRQQCLGFSRLRER